MEDKILEEVIVKPVVKTKRVEQSERARTRRHKRREIVSQRLSNFFAKLRRMKKKSKKKAQLALKAYKMYKEFKTQLVPQGNTGSQATQGRQGIQGHEGRTSNEG